ncbi:MAG TPA: hypothetical protein VIW24_30370 [Aldersonia sp.]
MRFVAVTSCPPGIAHTYMAAESREQGAARLGHEIHGTTAAAPPHVLRIPQIVCPIPATGMFVLRSRCTCTIPVCSTGTAGTERG